MHMHHGCVTKIVRDHGYPVRVGGKPPSPPTAEDCELVRRLHDEEGLLIPEIMERTGVHRGRRERPRVRGGSDGNVLRSRLAAHEVIARTQPVTPAQVNDLLRYNEVPLDETAAERVTMLEALQRAPVHPV